MADVARVKADIKTRLMSEAWRKQYLTVVVVKAAIDGLTADDGDVLVQGFLRGLDADVGRFLRDKVDAELSAIADVQIDAATADNCLDLDEYERLIG